MAKETDQAQQFDADLAAIDFSQILGGPMVAAVNAQAQSAMVTLDFIEAVGFKHGSGDAPKGGQGGGENGDNTSMEVQNVDFTYDTAVKQPDGTIKSIPNKLSVPLLSMVPIPSLRVQQLSVDLNVKLSSIEKSESKNQIAKNAKAESSGFLSMFSPVKFSASVASQSSSSSSRTVTENYSLGVRMLAVQDKMPGGLDKILGILEDSITQNALEQQDAETPPKK